jgi:hypothetical protein
LKQPTKARSSSYPWSAGCTTATRVRPPNPQESGASPESSPSARRKPAGAPSVSPRMICPGFTAVLPLTRSRSAPSGRSDDPVPSSTGHISPAGKHSPPRRRKNSHRRAAFVPSVSFRYPQEGQNESSGGLNAYNTSTSSSTIAEPHFGEEWYYFVRPDKPATRKDARRYPINLWK